MTYTMCNFTYHGEVGSISSLRKRWSRDKIFEVMKGIMSRTKSEESQKCHLMKLNPRILEDKMRM
jgi:hypothetical protein